MKQLTLIGIIALVFISACSPTHTTIKETQVIQQKETAIIDLPGHWESMATCNAYGWSEDVVRFNVTLVLDSYPEKRYIKEGERLLIVPDFHLGRHTNGEISNWEPPYGETYDLDATRCYFEPIAYNVTLSGRTFQDEFVPSWGDCENGYGCGLLEKIIEDFE